MNDESTIFTNKLSRQIWESKYRYSEDGQTPEQRIQDSWQRVAHTLASAELNGKQQWQEAYYSILDDFRFLPGGRILASSGVKRDVTLFNCFVMGQLEDSIDGIFDSLKEAALTMQQGGGVGSDFSNLRPNGSHSHRTGSIASGPVSFMRIWDSMCATLLSTGIRRGAMMATLRCDHPDIEEFIRAKQEPQDLRHFNLSVLVTDEFMDAVQQDKDWPLVFPVSPTDITNDQTYIERNWNTNRPLPCQVMRTIKAKKLWQQIIQANYDYAEPGVLFIDRINQQNNLSWCETIRATNPCGEIPLPPYGACNLGSINLVQFVHAPFSAEAKIDLDAICQLVKVAVRFMDNVIDVSRYPLPQQKHQAHASRRLGLGVTGLADSLIMLGLAYNSAQAREQAAAIMQTIRDTAYETSIELAKEKGSFPLLNKARYLATPFIQNLPEALQQAIQQHGIRNSHLLAIAPTGTISLLANNISSGIEPVFQWQYQRRILQPDNQYAEFDVTDYSYQLWQQQHPDETLPDYFIHSDMLHPHDHLAMQAAIQPFVDNAISKTINIPEDYPFSQFQDVYLQAYTAGLKGCTTYRPNPVTGSILGTQPHEQGPCCSIDRESD